MDGRTAQALLWSREALYDLAGPRRSVKEMEGSPCHKGISTMAECGRCSRQFAAWKAIDAIDKVLPKGLIPHPQDALSKMASYLTLKHNFDSIKISRGDRFIGIIVTTKTGAQWRFQVNSGNNPEDAANELRDRIIDLAVRGGMIEGGLAT